MSVGDNLGGQFDPIDDPFMPIEQPAVSRFDYMPPTWNQYNQMPPPHQPYQQPMYPYP